MADESGEWLMVVEAEPGDPRVIGEGTGAEQGYEAWERLLQLFTLAEETWTVRLVDAASGAVMLEGRSWPGGSPGGVG